MQAPAYPVPVTGRKADFALGNETQSDIAIGRLDFDVTQDATLSLISGYVRQEQQYALDFYDGSGAPSLSNPYPAVRGAEFGGFVIANDSYADQFSQEAKLSGTLGDGLVDYTTGVYYIKEKNYSDFADIFGLSTTSALLLADRVLRNSTEAIKPISAMEGRFTWACSTGRVQGRVQRAPTGAVTIQALEFGLAQP